MAPQFFQLSGSHDVGHPSWFTAGLSGPSTDVLPRHIGLAATPGIRVQHPTTLQPGPPTGELLPLTSQHARRRTP